MDEKYKGICQICLRIDKKVHKTKSSNITRFYREMCKCSSEISIGNPGVQCCLECEYLLIKMYHFKQKCVIASNILECWRISKLQEPLNTIYQKLPPTSLGLWIPENSKTFYYQEDEFAKNTIKEEDIDIHENTPYNEDTQYDELPDTKDDVQTDIDIHENTPYDENTQYDELPDTKDDVQNFEVPPSNQVPESNNKPSLEVTLTNSASRQASELMQVKEGKIGVLASINILKTESLSEPVPNEVVQSNTSSKTQRKASALVKKTKPPKKNKSDTNGPVLCLQDIFTSLTKGIKQTENKILDEDNLNVIEDHDYCEPEGVPLLPIRKSPRVREAVKCRKITKKPKVSKANKKKKEKIHFSKESFKEVLSEYFSSSGDLKTFKGITIDKEFILSLVDNKLSEKRMQALWNLLCGSHKMPLGVRRILGVIQNIYRNDEYESVFDIVYLKTEEEVRQEFQNRKTYKCYTDAPFKCEICYEGFTHEKRLIYHQKCHTESEGKVVCDICNKRFADRCQLTSHRPKHDMVFKCKLCPLVTIHREGMINHFNQHNGMLYQCTLCGATFRSQSVLHAHTYNFCSAALHFCTICGRKFLKEPSLKLHLVKDHKDEPPTDPEHCVPCSKCNLQFSTERAMLKHCRSAHGTYWLCLPNRRQRKSTPGDTQKEYKTKKPVDKRRTCKVCNEVCESKQWLKLHFMQKHPEIDMVSLLYPTPPPHLCHICGRSFNVLSSLNHHLMRHSGIRPFECAECHKRFQRKSVLIQHMFFHRPPEHVCYICGKMFRIEVNMMKHIEMHKNDRQYKCHICGKGFNQFYSVKLHFTAVHQQKRRVKKKRVVIAAEAVELVYSGNESDEIASSKDVTEVQQKIRRSKRKRNEIAPEATEIALSEDVRVKSQKIRVKKKRDEISPETTELVYSGNDSDENSWSGESTE